MITGHYKANFLCGQGVYDRCTSTLSDPPIYRIQGVCPRVLLRLELSKYNHRLASFVDYDERSRTDAVLYGSVREVYTVSGVGPAATRRVQLQGR